MKMSFLSISFILALLSFSKTLYAQGQPGCSGYEPTYYGCSLYQTCPTVADCVSIEFQGCSEGRLRMKSNQSHYCETYTQSECVSKPSHCEWLNEVLTVYNGKDFNGGQINLPIDRHTHRNVLSGQFDKLHDAASSVVVPPKTCLSLYSDRFYDGATLTLQPGSYKLTDFAFDDYASSWSVISLGTSESGSDPCGPPDAILYWGWDQQGDKFPLRAGRDQRRLGKFNDDATSVWVANNRCLVLYGQADFQGEVRSYGPGYHNLNGFNDRASSAKVLNFSCS